MNFKNLYNPTLIVHLQSTKKNEAIKELVSLIHTNKLINDTDIAAVIEQIFHREKLMSTGIGKHLGIPHIRISCISSPIVAIGIQPDGIDAYESMDGLPIKMLIMILCGSGQHKLHIQILSQIVSVLKRNDTINRILTAKNGMEIYHILNES